MERRARRSSPNCERMYVCVCVEESCFQNRINTCHRAECAAFSNDALLDGRLSIPGSSPVKFDQRFDFRLRLREMKMNSRIGEDEIQPLKTYRAIFCRRFIEY